MKLELEIFLENNLYPPHEREYHKRVMCAACDGKGLSNHSELNDYHRGTYNDWTTTCPRCQGSGRLSIKATILVTPYVQPAPDK